MGQAGGEDSLMHVFEEQIRESLATFAPDIADKILLASPEIADHWYAKEASQHEKAAIVSFFKTEVGSSNIFHWINNPETFESFDGLLNRGDKNPNTKGLLEVLKKHGVERAWKELTDGVSTGAIKTVVVAGPENLANFPDMKSKVAELSKASKLVWLGSAKSSDLEMLSGDVALLPTKSYVEKEGTFVNFAGLRQTIKKVTTIVPGALSLTEAVQAMRGENVLSQAKAEAGVVQPQVGQGRIYNEFTLTRGVW